MTAIYLTTVVGPDFLYKSYRKSRIKLINSAYREGTIALCQLSLLSARMKVGLTISKILCDGITLQSSLVKRKRDGAKKTGDRGSVFVYHFEMSSF